MTFWPMTFWSKLQQDEATIIHECGNEVAVFRPQRVELNEADKP